MKKIHDVKYEYVDDEGFLHIEVFFTDDRNEPSTLACVVSIDTGKAFFLDQVYRNNKDVMMVVDATKESILERQQKVVVDPYAHLTKEQKAEIRAKALDMTMGRIANGSDYVVHQWLNTLSVAEQLEEIDQDDLDFCPETGINLGKYYSIYDAQCGRWLATGRDSSSIEECANAGIEYLFGIPDDEGYPVIKDALKWSLNEKIKWLCSSELEVEAHDEPIGDEYE